MYGKNEQLEQRVEQYREQMELQRESYSSRQNESSNFREILRKKDKEMNAVLDQIEVSVSITMCTLCYTTLDMTHYYDQCDPGLMCT